MGDAKDSPPLGKRGPKYMGNCVFGAEREGLLSNLLQKREHSGNDRCADAGVDRVQPGWRTLSGAETDGVSSTPGGSSGRRVSRVSALWGGSRTCGGGEVLPLWGCGM